MILERIDWKNKTAYVVGALGQCMRDIAEIEHFTQGDKSTSYNAQWEEYGDDIRLHIGVHCCGSVHTTASADNEEVAGVCDLNDEEIYMSEGDTVEDIKAWLLSESMDFIGGFE